MRPVPLASLPQSVQDRITSKPKRRSPRRRAVPKKAASGHLFRLLCKQSGLPMPTCEHRFHPTRRWRFDYAWTEELVALEVDGGIFTSGAHVRGARILKTHEKLNVAAGMGWRVLYCVPRNLCTTETLDLVRQALSSQPHAKASLDPSPLASRIAALLPPQP